MNDRVDYQQAGAVVSNTCLTGPFTKHVKTTHTTDQNKNLYSLGKQQNKSMLKGFWKSLLCCKHGEMESYEKQRPYLLSQESL